jgi:hypothetical protein
MNCEFCGIDINNQSETTYRNDITFHADCLKRAIATLAKYSKSLNPLSKRIAIGGLERYMIIRDPTHTDGPTPKEIFDYQKAKRVAHEMCERYKTNYWIVLVTDKVELVK